jgi:hypothetical protein
MTKDEVFHTRKRIYSMRMLKASRPLVFLFI